MLIDTSLLAALAAHTRTFSHLRQHYDLRDSTEDQSQRMLNALEPGTMILESKDWK